MFLSARRWRRGRPFWGGLWVALGGAAILLTPLAPLPFIVQQGVAGVSGYLVGLLLLAVGPLSWVQTAQHVFFGIVAMALSLVSFVTSNLGGFGLGMILGITGGALLVSWVPVKHPRTVAPRSGGSDHPVALPVVLTLVLHGGSAPAEHLTRARGHAPVIHPATGDRRLVAGVAESGLGAGRLTVSGARFAGVVFLPTMNGPRRYLEVSMDTAEIAAGEHWIRHAEATIRQQIPSMRLSGGVVMYVTRLRARVGGVAVTFTPDFPPLLLPPSLTVTDLEADRLLVRAARVAVDGLGQQVRT